MLSGFAILKHEAVLAIANLLLTLNISELIKYRFYIIIDQLYLNSKGNEIFGSKEEF